MEFARKDLVILLYANNNCYTNVVTADDPQVGDARVVIDEKKGTWTAPPSRDPINPRETYEIGEHRHLFSGHGGRWGVIGVYDRTNLDHLDSMVRAGQEAVKPQGSLLEG